MGNLCGQGTTKKTDEGVTVTVSQSIKHSNDLL